AEQPAPGRAPPGAGEEGGDARLAIPPSSRILRCLEAGYRHPRSEAQPMKLAYRVSLALAATLGLAAPAAAQLHVDVTAEGSEKMTIAVPVMPTPQPADTPAGGTVALGRQVADVVAGD